MSSIRRRRSYRVTSRPPTACRISSRSSPPCTKPDPGRRRPVRLDRRIEVGRGGVGLVPLGEQGRQAGLAGRPAPGRARRTRSAPTGTRRSRRPGSVRRLVAQEPFGERRAVQRGDPGIAAGPGGGERAIASSRSAGRPRRRHRSRSRCPRLARAMARTEALAPVARAASRSSVIASSRSAGTPSTSYRSPSTLPRWNSRTGRSGSPVAVDFRLSRCASIAAAGRGAGPRCWNWARCTWPRADR